MKKQWFTLLEILLSVTWFFLLMTIVINSYIGIVSFRYSFQARSKLLETTYYMFEKVNLLLRDYKIDYEEYFNRSRVGCDSLANPSWNVWLNWYCDLFTSYGNSNFFSSVTGNHNFYYCSSLTWYKVPSEYVVYQPSLSDWCSTWTFQSFWQYAIQFLDTKSNADFDPSVVHDSDDIDLGKWPESVMNSTWVKELYLISKDKQYRVLIRRALIATWEFDGISWTSENEMLYALQMLKLRSFDAWSNHLFNGSWVYDWTLDTWTCDYSQWFICGWTSIGNIYSWYRLPLNVQDVSSWWVNLFDNSITVTDRNIMIYPTKDPDLAWWQQSVQISPYFVLSLKTKLYAWVWQKKIKWSMNDYQFTLQTTFTTKDNY